MKYHIAQLQASLAHRTPKYLFFWGHKPSPDGKIGSTCMSQWWEGHPFEEEGVLYRTAEHYMMAGKACLFEDQEIREKILNAPTPGEAKKLGRAVRNFEQAKWNTHRCDIVIQGNYLKFSQHPDLRAYLLQTQSRVIVEASPVDQIWGIGLTKDDPQAHNPHSWKGPNLLGFCLMEVRDRLFKQ